MSSKSSHSPTIPGSTRVRCPVCHEAVYSRAGIHPQCAIKQSNPPKPKIGTPAPPDPAQPSAETEAPA